MRCFKLLLMGGIVLALSVPASAFSFKANLTDYDDGTIYVINDPANPYVGEAACDGIPVQYPPTGGLISGVQSDTWGIFLLENIKNLDTGSNWYTWDEGVDEITALFWGERDTYLDQVTASDGTITQNIHGVGMHVAFFRQYDPPAGEEWPGNATGPAGWTVNDNGTPADTSDDFPEYAGITDGTCIWTMNSTTGFNKDFLNDEFFAEFIQAQATFESSGDVVFDVGPVPGYTGVKNWTINNDAIAAWEDLDGPGGNDPTKTKMVDISIHFEGTEENRGDWLLLTSDPMVGDIIPEPVTMAGMLLGIGCLGRYIRRRR